jgi:hypothetical protein
MQAGRLRIRACLCRHVVARARVMPAMAGVRVRGRRAAVLAAILRRSRHRAAALRVAALALRDLNHAPPRVRYSAVMCTTHANVTPAAIQALRSASTRPVGKIYRDRCKRMLFRRGAFGPWRAWSAGAFGLWGRGTQPHAAGLHRHVARDRMRGCARRRGRTGRRGGSAVAGSRVLLAARCRPREVRDQGQRAGPLRGADARGRRAGCQRRLLRAPRRRSTLLRDPGRRRQRAARSARLVVRRFVRGAVASAGNGDCTADVGAGDTRIPLDRHAPACPRRIVLRRLGEHAVCAGSASAERASVARPAIH